MNILIYIVLTFVGYTIETMMCSILLLFLFLNVTYKNICFCVFFS